MIPLHNKEVLIKSLEEGYTVVDACLLAKMSRASLYRLFKEQPGFKRDVEEAIFKGTKLLEGRVKDIEARNLQELKAIIRRRGQK